MAKPTGEITLAAQPVKVGAQWHVVGTYPSGQQERITGFKTEADALDWIANDSAAWLEKRQRRFKEGCVPTRRRLIASGTADTKRVAWTLLSALFTGAKPNRYTQAPTGRLLSSDQRRSL